MRESPSIGHPRPCLAADNSSMVTFGWQSTQARDGHVPAVPGSVVSGRGDLESGNIIDFSSVVGVEELDGVLPGREAKASRVLSADAVLDCRDGAVVFHVVVLGSPASRPEWWGPTDDGLSMSLECRGGVRVRTESVENPDGLTFKTLEDGGVEALLVCQGRAIRVKSRRYVLKDFKSMRFGSDHAY